MLEVNLQSIRRKKTRRSSSDCFKTRSACGRVVYNSQPSDSETTKERSDADPKGECNESKGGECLLNYFVGRINEVPSDMTMHDRVQMSDGVPYPTYRPFHLDS